MAADLDRVALVAGATGLVGREILAALLADKSYRTVHTLGRRRLDIKHPKLVQHLTNLATLPQLPNVDDVFIALGTTIKVAGSQAAFRAVDLDAVVAVAQAARANGATRLAVVSAMGADPKSKVFYNRIKGEMEAAVSSIGYTSVTIARPSMISGDRAALQQADRPGESWGLVAMQALKILIPNDYRAVLARDVAWALVAANHKAKPGVQCLLSGALQGASASSA